MGSATVAHVPGNAPGSTGPSAAHSRLVLPAVRLAAAAAVAIAVSLATFALAYAIGGADATAYDWVGALVVISMLAGAFASLAAFATAVVAKVKHERWALLWLPLSVFPSLLAFVVLGESFWWE